MYQLVKHCYAPLQPAEVIFNNELLGWTKNRTHVGSVTSSSSKRDRELTNRTGKARGVLSKIGERLWKNRQVPIEAKSKVLSAVVL